MARIDARRFLNKHAGWAAMNLGFAAMDFRSRVAEGQSRFQAAASAATTAALFEMFPGVGMALVASNLIRAGLPAYNAIQQQRSAQWSRYFNPNMGGNFRDTQQAMTMRARAAQQIGASHQLARSVLGREARFMS